MITLKNVYKSPQTEVIEMKTEGILCQSDPNELEPYEREDW